MQAAVDKEHNESDQLDHDMIPEWLLACLLSCYQQRCVCDREPQCKKFRVSSDLSHQTAAESHFIWGTVLNLPHDWEALTPPSLPHTGMCPFSVRRGAILTRTAIKDDNNTVHVGNFGHRSGILLTFIGSNRWHVSRINTERGAQSVSQTSRITEVRLF